MAAGERIAYVTADYEGIECIPPEEAAIIIDKHMPGYEELLAALKNMVAFFDVSRGSALPDALKAQYRALVRRDPHCREALAAIAAAEPK
jgi:hypothetical protein